MSTGKERFDVLPEVRALDRLLGAELARSFPDGDADCTQLATLASAAVGDGHGALDLTHAVPALGWDRARAELACDKLRAWSAVGDGSAGSPLVLDAHGRLYLRRYHAYEQQVASRLRALASAGGEPSGAHESLIDRLFAGTESDARQRDAVRHALSHRLTVVLGGPGTGKTHTVLRILAALAASGLVRPTRMLLAAPTGKAAQRLAEALAAGRGALGADGETLPAQVRTLHRLLGATPLSTAVRHDAARPLPCELLVVDEASMVDVALFARVLDALGPQARLVLLGDPDQLSSVEAGSVLSELSRLARDSAAPATVARSIVRLAVNRRSAPDSALPSVLAAVAAQDADALATQLRTGLDITWLTQTDRTRAAQHIALEWLRAVVEAPDAAGALAALADVRVLVPLREGRQGVVGWNAELMRALGLQVAPGAPPRHGTPLLVTRNDPGSGLSNGDVVLAWGHGPGTVADQLWYERAPGEAVSLPVGMLPPHEPALALTVHKAQGSEYGRVLVVLTDAPHPLLTREWLYTALSRARRELVLCGSADVLLATLAASGRRVSGLFDALRDAPESAPHE